MTMNEYQTPAMQQLETAFTFQSVSGKNSGFLASTRGQDFAFGSYPCGAPELLFIHAAGHISYTVPVRYTLAPTSYLIVMLTVRGNAVLRCPNGDISLARHDFLLFPPGFTLQFATGETPFSYYLCFVSGVLAEQYLPPPPRRKSLFASAALPCIGHRTLTVSFHGSAAARTGHRHRAARKRRLPHNPL